MKPSDLRRDAYTWQAIANSAKDRAATLRTSDSTKLRLAGGRMELAAAAIHQAIEHMNEAADELGARNAS